MLSRYRNIEYWEIITDMEFACREELQATKSEVFEAWSRSQRFECSGYCNRYALRVERANSILIWLKAPQRFGKPSNDWHALGELVPKSLSLATNVKRFR